MAKSLFDHIKAITNEQNPKYFDTLDESYKVSSNKSKKVKVLIDNKNE